MLERVRGNLIRIEDALLVALIASMIGLAGLQIVLRNIWGSGLIWSEPLLRIAVLWVGLCGAMIATRLNEHIRIDLLSRFLPLRARRWADAINNIVAAAVCALLAFHGARFVLFDWEDGIAAFATVPAWLCELIIPIGFAIMTLRFAFNAVASLRH